MEVLPADLTEGSRADGVRYEKPRFMKELKEKLHTLAVQRGLHHPNTDARGGDMHAAVESQEDSEPDDVMEGEGNTEAPTPAVPAGPQGPVAEDCSATDAAGTQEPAVEASATDKVWEVQGCESSCDWPCSKCGWEECYIVAREGNRATVQIISDGAVVENVLMRSIREMSTNSDDAGEEPHAPARRLPKRARRGP